MSAPSSAKEVAMRWFNDVWNCRETDAIPLLNAEDCVAHLEGGLDIQGKAQFVRYQAELLEVLPDIQLTIRHAIGEGELACIHWEARAVHGVSGKAVSFTGSTWQRVVDGRIVESWDTWNQAGLHNQLAGD